MKRIISIIVAGCLAAVSAFAQNDYQVAVFGTYTDGKTDNTATIQRAIDFVSEKGGGTITFAVGRYLTGAIELKSNVKLLLREGAVLVAAPSIYNFCGNPALVWASGAENISIEGKGCIECSGPAVRASIADQKAKGYLDSDKAPAVISFENCTNASVREIKIVNPAGEVAVGVTLEGVHIYDYAEGTCILPSGKKIKLQK